VAVLAALLIVAVVAALSTSLFQRQAAAVRQTANAQDRVQARWLLVGGLDWARLMLRDHARRESTTRNDQLWATPLPDTRIERAGDARVAVFSGTIQDEQGKYNLYNVATLGVIQPAQLETLRRLLANLDLPDTLAVPLAERVAAAQPRRPAEQEEAETAQPSAQAPLPRGIDELAALAGADAASRASLRRAMTLLPTSTSINVNTAPPEVLAALVPELSLSQARSLAGERDRGRWFVNSGDFANRLAGMARDIAAPTVVTASSWFMATGTVVYENARITMQALIRNSANTEPETIWLREVP